jgi:hypothetical protein
MVLPAIAATGRVIAGSARTTTRTSTKGNFLQRTAIRNQRDRRIAEELEYDVLDADTDGLRSFPNQTRLKQLVQQSPSQTVEQRNQESKQSIARVTFRRVRAISTTMATMGIYFWYYLIQFAFGVIFIVGNYVESSWTGWFVDGHRISMVGWGVCSIISLVFMFIAIVSLVVARAKVGKDLTMLMFLVGITGSIVPYFNLIPWPAFFMAVAVANQK